ncbi:MAG: DUF885 domain-containing protein [Streptosporangiaceae bacterium]
MSFAKLADDYLDDLAQRHPDTATELGDHRFDARLPIDTPEALDDERRALDRFGERLAAIDEDELSAEDGVDAEVIVNQVERRIFALDELREHTWNPLLANPGRSIYQLLAREFAPLEDRLASVAGRLAQLPEALAVARRTLRDMPDVHTETAVGQFNGTISMVRSEVDAALEKAPAMRAEIDAVRPAALAALAEHVGWLESKRGGNADPRIGPELFARKLSLMLNSVADSDAVLARAESDLDNVTEQITEVAASLGGSPREVLDRLATDVPDEATILGFCADALALQTEFVRSHGIVTIYDDPVELIEMPEIDRGVAVAYCDPPGPLEPAPLPTFLAVSPAPSDWPAERVASFYREYNRHLVHDLMVHEAMPGHYLQLQHSRRYAGATRVRAALWTGSFVEGWAVYAERVMAEHGYPGEGDPRAFRMQQLKMQLRMTINAILDARVQAHGMTEDEAMRLMLERGFQEEGEAAGKWRRVQLTSVQLSTYYVGYTEVSDLAAELRASGLDQRTTHDHMLAHGSPPVRLLRSVI